MIYEVIRAAFVPLGFLFISLLVVLYLRIYRFSDRTAYDVAAYLRPVDLEQVRDLLSPEPEQYLRLNLAAAQFKTLQRKRIHLGLEHIGRLAHNAGVLRGWGRYELRRGQRTRDRKARRASRELVSAGVQCQILGLVLRLKLHVWLFRMALFPFLPAPRFASLLRLGSVDLPAFYEKTKAAATELSRIYGPEYHERLVQVL